MEDRSAISAAGLRAKPIAACDGAQWPPVQWRDPVIGRVDQVEFRALRAAELEAWFDHAETVFSVPRQHFVNHWSNDPWKDLEGIRVAVDGGRIASTVRLFLRRMYLGGVPVAVGGIGEVSTLPEYRRRGLATRLLQDAVGFMRERGIALSSLAGDQRIYGAEGWERIPLYYARTQMAAEADGAFHIRPADLGVVAELETLAALYDAYARRFNGTIVRDHPGYWEDWFTTESPRVWVAEAEGAIKAYVSLSETGDAEGLEVKEFVAGNDIFELDGGRRAFAALIGQGIAATGRDAHTIVFPAPVARGFEACEVEELGNLMYRVIDGSRLPRKFDCLGDLLHRQPEAWDQGLLSHHVFWTTDGF